MEGRNPQTNSNNKPELALPAGSLQCALYAFKGGADAVYLGLKEFSARKGAVNFTFEDVRKLKQMCLSQNKKFYITLNTLVTDEELLEVERLLKQLEYLKPDGIIVQDLGIARLMREKHPGLPLHGSTQLAVHTIQGVKELQEMGFSRVVLSRELSFNEVEKIRKACPDVELKVFVHGALCYGFSGLCMASECITGRSANRGACAQICRTWFSCNAGNGSAGIGNAGNTKKIETDSWLFSMKDLCIGELVREYARIGIDSLKIEGRMKGPEYVYWCARYYSLLLDGRNEDDRDVQLAKEFMQTSFSRETTTGFFRTPKDTLTCTDYPSHRGIRVGTIEKVMNNKAVIRFEKPVALRDGLLVISQGEKNNESAGFGLSFIEGGRSFINEGETATVNFPSQAFSKRPGFGTTVWCTSRHNQNLPLLNENIPLYKEPVDIAIRILSQSLEINGKSYEVDAIQEAKNPTDAAAQIKGVFEASDRSLFTLGSLKVENESGTEHPFLPLSILKRIRRSFYEDLDNGFERSIVSASTRNTAQTTAKTELETARLPKRKDIGLWDEIVKVGDSNGSETEFLPLSPLMFDEEEYFNKLDGIVEAHPHVIVGLNNVAQIEWAKRHPETRVFADFFLYTYNRLAYEELKEGVPSLVGSYETRKDSSFTYVGEDFKVPLFVSRVCLRRNSLGPLNKGLSCSGCSKDNTYHISQNDRRYKVRCKECITIVTEA